MASASRRDFGRTFPNDPLPITLRSSNESIVREVCNVSKTGVRINARAYLGWLERDLDMNRAGTALDRDPFIHHSLSPSAESHDDQRAILTYTSLEIGSESKSTKT